MSDCVICNSCYNGAEILPGLGIIEKKINNRLRMQKMMDSQKGEKVTGPRHEIEESPSNNCCNRGFLRFQPKIREQISLSLLAVVYLLASVRYFPGQALHSMVETMIHVLSVAPINLGATLIIVAVLQRLVKERLPLSRTLRFYFVVAICLEFILGLAHYFEMNGAV